MRLDFFDQQKIEPAVAIFFRNAFRVGNVKPANRLDKRFRFRRKRIDADVL
jgi:hypothetical protein